MPQYFDFHIHGDNIVECERTFELIKSALIDKITEIIGPSGSPFCPEYNLILQGLEHPLHLTFFPGFGRWNENILDYIRRCGGILREAADAIISGVTGQSEEPLIAIEYCGALPAGNQAWQRSGRAYSFGKARIPYLYVAELGGYELDENRVRKAPRMPNPAIPFSYLSFSLEQSSPVLPVFVTSPGADDISRRFYAEEFADNELIALIRAIILNESPDQSYEILRRKVFSFVQKKASTARIGNTLSAEQWSDLYNNIRGGIPLADYLVSNARLRWSKTAYIDGLTDTARSLMNIASEFAIGLTSSGLPICVIPKDLRPAFASAISELYGDLPQDFFCWLSRNEHLAICWIMGFKPRGDDARPDRGLPPLTRMLIGNNHDLLSIIYGPAPSRAWSMLINNPSQLIEQNGLWESIFAVSDSILVDSRTDHVSHHGFLRTHWQTAIIDQTRKTIFANPLPIRFGENDVDTVLHTLLKHHAGDDVFEGMCNPPGGDWSGVSLLSLDRSLKLRWLSLPRVSGNDTKRPDHVFQFFDLGPLPIILSIESKETAISVEANIGPRLSTYIANLITSPASVEREDLSLPWRHSTHRLIHDRFTFASAIAFIPTLASQINSVITTSQADLVFAFTFQVNDLTCHIQLYPTSIVGRLISSYLSGLDLTRTGISIAVG